jgi:hypothetical protein
MQPVTCEPAIANEYIEACEDKIARMITASEQVSSIRQAFKVLHKRQKVTTAFYNDACDSLTFIDSALLDGKQAIATLRNARRAES